MEIFFELTLILAVAFGISILMRILKQPLIIGYILSGIIVGPYVLNITQSQDVIHLFSKLGITILLFIVGIHLSPSVIKEVGKVSVLTGVSQVVITSLVGFVIAIILGIERIAALYVAIALTFSSTIIILKLLSDKGDLHKLYGRIAIGFLIVQDVIATIILLFASSFQGASEFGIMLILAQIALKSLILCIGIFVMMKYLLPKVEGFLSASQELLFLFSISWGFGFALLFHQLGFSVEIGALVGGVTLSTASYSYEVSSRLRPLRDFFILIFFILLGSQMVFDNFLAIFVPALILSLFVLIGNPIIMTILMNLLRYGKRTSFLTGLTVAQISEFSLILAALGFQLGHLDRNILSLITLVGLITISVSTYLIMYADSVYPYVETILDKLQLVKKTNKTPFQKSYNALLFGYHRIGADFLSIFEKLGLEGLVVDYNPASIEELTENGIQNVYGDASDAEFIADLNVKNVRFVISTIPDFQVNSMIVRDIRRRNENAIIIIISHNVSEARSLYHLGATYVIMPHFLGAQHAVRMITKYGLKKHDYQDIRSRHLQYLTSRVV